MHGIKLTKQHNIAGDARDKTN